MEIKKTIKSVVSLLASPKTFAALQVVAAVFTLAEAYKTFRKPSDDRSSEE